MPDWPCPGARRSNRSYVAKYSSQRPPHSIAQMRDVMGRRQALLVIIVRTAPADKLVRGAPPFPDTGPCSVRGRRARQLGGAAEAYGGAQLEGFCILAARDCERPEEVAFGLACQSP